MEEITKKESGFKKQETRIRIRQKHFNLLRGVVDLSMPISTGEKIIKTETNTQKITVTDVQPLVTGGLEGKKYRIIATDSDGQEQFLVSKEFDPNDLKNEERLDEVVKAFRLLNELNFPCPRYVEKITEEGVTYLLATDLTEGGKYKIWGMSSGMIKEQQDELMEMNLSPTDLALLEAQARAVASNAERNGLNIKYYNYHVIHDPETGENSIALLDVDKDLYSDSGKENGVGNYDDAEFFVKKIEFATGVKREPYVYAPENAQPERKLVLLPKKLRFD